MEEVESSTYTSGGAGAYFCATQGEAQRAGGKGRRERPICETKRGEVLLKLNDFKGFST